ncbi:hypothetical protein MMC21_008301 [Puttea exsequens]|nr:hypothetical protein [Puttea exsequens]
MTAKKSVPQGPQSAKTLIYDCISKTLDFADRPIPTPDFTKNEHLIHVKAIALCARELMWPLENPDALFAENPTKEITPGYDIAGIIVIAPPGSPFQPGAEIYACTDFSRPGNYRKYSIVRTEEMALKPQKMAFVDAATVPLSALTAWQALFQHAEMGGVDGSKAVRKRVLVTAAAGGVGVWAVQLARIAGLEVVAQIGSAKNDQFVRALGASKTLNYRLESLKSWAEREGCVDIVLDLKGGATLTDAWFAVKDGGTFISIAEPPGSKRPEVLKDFNVKNGFFIVSPNGRSLTEITKLLESGQCRPILDSVWEFGEFEKAFERLDRGHASGKVVIKIAKGE